MVVLQVEVLKRTGFVVASQVPVLTTIVATEFWILARYVMTEIQIITMVALQVVLLKPTGLVVEHQVPVITIVATEF